MRIEDLAMINDLVRFPNLSFIAEKRGMTQSALSKALKKIETDLGFSLFVRKGFRGLEPTAQCLKLIQSTDFIPLSWNEALSRVRDDLDLQAEMKVSGPSMFMRSIFIPGWFQAKLHDSFHLSYRQSRMDQLPTLARGGALDLVITPHTNEFPDWVATPLFEESEALFVNRRVKEDLERIDLAPLKWLSFRAHQDPTRTFLRQKALGPSRIVAAIDDPQAILNLIAGSPDFASILPGHVEPPAGVRRLILREKVSSLFLMSKPETLPKPLLKRIRQACRDFSKTTEV